MIIRVIFGSVVGAIILFFWGFVYWNILGLMISPWKPFPSEHEADLVAKLNETLPESGVYTYPWADASQGDQEGLEEKLEQPAVIYY